jgi:putative ABC transport system permease protein
MILWLFRLPFRHLRDYPGRTLLGIGGIALGTAVYLSISLAATSALRSFQAGVGAVAGQAQLRLQSPGAPLDEALLGQVRRLPEIQATAPLIQSMLELTGSTPGPALLLGIDLFSEGPFRYYDFAQGFGINRENWLAFLTQPDTVLISEPLAARLGVKVNDHIPVRVGAATRQFRLAGIFRTPGNLYPLGGAIILMDIGQAQELLDRIGKLDWIDLRLTGKAEEVAKKLQKLLPSGVEAVLPGSQAAQMEGLVGAYRLNLSVLSAMALFVGMFLIYQSITLSVVRRRREIGLLRTLGATSRQVLLLFLTEAAVSGAVGGGIGLILGMAVAQGALGLVTQNLSSLYLPIQAEKLAWEWPLFLQAWVLTIAATVGAAWFPAREAAHTRPRAVWSREELEEKLENRAGALFGVGVGLLALAAVLALGQEIYGRPLPGLLAALLILLGFALFTPLTVRSLGKMLQPIMGRLGGIAGELGCRYLAGSISRSAVSIAALSTALALVIAVVVMIGSFRQTVDQWINQSISGDIFLGPAIFSTGSYDHYLPPEVLTDLEKDPEVADLYHYRCVRIPFGDRFILVIGGSLDVLARHGALWFRQGDGPAILNQARTLSRVIVSEPFARTFKLQEGDPLELPTPSGTRRLTIAGVFYDYRTDGSSIWMDLSLFRSFWPDQHLNAVRIYLKDKNRLPEFQAWLDRKYHNRYHLLSLSHQELRQQILRIFDETFALTYALEGVAVLVAVFGIISTFLVLVMERERDLALLQALGTSKRQILGMILVESGLASCLSFVLGALSGSVLALLLILVINKQAFGWTIQLYWQPHIYWQSLLLVLTLGLAAGAYPAARALQPHLAVMLKEE